MTLPIVSDADMLRTFAADYSDQLLIEDRECIERAADTIEGLASLLTRAAPFVGWAVRYERKLAGEVADRLCDEIDALLTKIGGSWKHRPRPTRWSCSNRSCLA